MIDINITVDQSRLPIECSGVRSLSHAGRGVGVQVDLLGELYHGDVVAGEAVALVVGVLCHGDINLSEGSLAQCGEVVFSKSDLITRLYTLFNALP